MTTRIFSSGIRRREDPRLISGRATYTDDLTLPNTCYAAILRSPHAHARIRRVNTSRARQQEGVLAVYTGADLDGVIAPIPCAWMIPNSDIKGVAHPAIARDVARYVGDAVAVVVAESRHQAQDALEFIEVDYEPLQAIVDPQRALEEGGSPTPCRCSWEPSLSLGGWRRRHRGRFPQPGSSGAGAHRSAASDTQCDGASIGSSPVGERQW